MNTQEYETEVGQQEPDAGGTEVAKGLGNVLGVVWGKGKTDTARGEELVWGTIMIMSSQSGLACFLVQG